MKIPLFKRIRFAIHVLRGRPLMYGLNIAITSGSIEYRSPGTAVVYSEIAFPDRIDSTLQRIIDDIPSPYRMEF